MSVGGINIDICRPVLKYKESETVKFYAFAQSKTDSAKETENSTSKSAKDTLSLSDEYKKTVENNQELTEEEQEAVKDLKARDQEVRRHEQAHKSAGGSLVHGGTSYTYQKGPDGNRYAIGGEVHIDATEVEGDPEATIKKMQQVRRAALAPSEPSTQDMKVAAEAANAESKARLELAKDDSAETEGVDAYA